MAARGGDQRPLPSDAAIRRLRAELDERVAAMAADVDRDLDAVGEALAGEREDQALEVLSAHLARFETFADDVRRTVVGSVAEREAEAVLDRATIGGRMAGQIDGRTGDQADAGEELGTGVVDAGDEPQQEGERPARERLLAGAARRGTWVLAGLLLAAVLVVPGRPMLAGDPLSAAVTASEQALLAAEGVAAGSPASLADLGARNAELRNAIAALDRRVLADPAVRQRIELMLADQQRVLAALAPGSPAASTMLAELRRLARSLALDLPDLAPAPSPQPGVALPAPRPAPDLDETPLPELPPVDVPGVAPDAPDTSAPGADDTQGPPAPDDAPAPDGEAPAEPPAAEPGSPQPTPAPDGDDPAPEPGPLGPTPPGLEDVLGDDTSLGATLRGLEDRSGP